MRISEHVYAPHTRQPRHAHGQLSCSFIIAGALQECVGRRVVTAGALSLVVKPPDTEHSDEYGSSAVRLVRITLDTAQARETVPWAAALGQWHWSHAGPATRVFLSLLRALRRHEADRGAPAADPMLETLAWDSLASLANCAGRGHGAGAPAWLERVREVLDDADRPPRLSEAAAAAGVHPVYLARQFRRFFGCSVSGYVHRLRVQRAAGLLGQARLPLSHVSFDAGFSDQSHMCRIFRRETGVTPSAYRELGRGFDRSRQDGEH